MVPRNSAAVRFFWTVGKATHGISVIAAHGAQYFTHKQYLCTPRVYPVLLLRVTIVNT